jgi:site-specific recombinase XerD
LLKFSDYRPNVGRLFVRRLKGSHSGEYQLTQTEQQALRPWLRERGGATGPLFVSRNHQPISRWRLDQLMKQYCERAGIPAGKEHMRKREPQCF